MNNKIEAIQEILFPLDPVEWDGVWGPKSQRALDEAVVGTHKVMASSFADEADLAAFARCKREGGYQANGRWHPGSTDLHCFEVGDNGIGAWRDPTVAGTGPSCAMTASEIKRKWGFLNAGHLKRVRVKYQDKEVVCLVKDILGTAHRIDLNQDACNALGLKVPVMAPVEWEWIDEPV